MAAAKPRPVPGSYFMTEDEVAALALKPLPEWRALVPVLERHGLPKRHPLFGYRHRRAVEAFFDRLGGVSSVAPAPMDGAENHDAL